MKRGILLILLLAMTAMLPQKAFALLIDTSVGWDFNESVEFLGEPSIASWSQKLFVPVDEQFIKFVTVYVDDVFDAQFQDSVDFSLYFIKWTSNRALPDIAYKSPKVTTTNNNGQGGFEEFTFQINKLLDHDPFVHDYAIILSTSEYFDGLPGRARIGARLSGDVYPRGRAYHNGNLDDLSPWFDGPPGSWSRLNSVDLVFKLEWSTAPATVVPEPSTLLLLAVGLGTLALRCK